LPAGGRAMAEAAGPLIGFPSIPALGDDWHPPDGRRLDRL